MDGRQAITLAMGPCIGGWNTSDAIDSMPQQDARELVNIFPERTKVVLRKGYSLHQTGLGGAVQTLVTHTSVTGTEKLIAGANGKLQDVSALGGTPTSLKSGLTNNKWQTVQFRDKLLLVNGADTPQQYDGSTVSDATYTGISDPTKLIHVHAHRKRLFFVEKDTAKIWYAPTDSFTGALASFDVSSLLSMGGNVLLNASIWGANTSGGYDSHLAIITKNGEVFVYGGSDPAVADDWGLVGNFVIPKPLGVRSVFYLGTETYILTVSGIVPLGKAMAAGEQFSQTGTLTDKINTHFNDRANGESSSFGWQATIVPEIRHLIVNSPKGTKFEQYIMNIESGAWTLYNNIQGACWAKFGNQPYFGTTTGEVFEANSGFDDNSAYINATLKTAFSYFGDPNIEKIFQMSKILIESNADFEPEFYLNTDNFDEKKTDTINVLGADGVNWDEATWDVDSWGTETMLNREWSSTPGYGRNASMVFKSSTSGVTYSILGQQMMFEGGGAL